MTWTAAYGTERCGLCGRQLERDEPLALLAGRLRRCAPCVPGEQPDWDAIHAQLEARRSVRTGDPVTNIRHEFTRVAPGSLDAALKDYGIKGVRRSKLKSYAEVANDPAVRRSTEDQR